MLCMAGVLQKGGNEEASERKRRCTDYDMVLARRADG